MELDVFGLLSKTENQARLFFKRFCWKSGHVFCSRCRCYKIYRIINKRYRCKRCGYTFHDFSNRWINKLNIGFKQWIWIIKLFELEIPTLRIAEQVRLSYKTVLKAVTILRTAVLINDGDPDEFLQNELKIDDICRGKEHRERNGSVSDSEIPVIRILSRDGIIKVRSEKYFQTEFIFSQTFNNNQRNSTVWNERQGYYSYLMFYDYNYLRVGHRRQSSEGKHCINTLESFLGYARERLSKFRGVSKKRFLLYMKEMEFRYNHRHENLYILFAQNLCTLVPIQMSKLT